MSDGPGWRYLEHVFHWSDIVQPAALSHQIPPTTVSDLTRLAIIPVERLRAQLWLSGALAIHSAHPRRAGACVFGEKVGAAVAVCGLIGLCS